MCECFLSRSVCDLFATSILQGESKQASSGGGERFPEKRAGIEIGDREIRLESEQKNGGFVCVCGKGETANMFFFLKMDCIYCRFVWKKCFGLSYIEKHEFG